MSSPIARLEQIIDASGVAGRIEALLPIGIRPRQLKARTLIIGILLVATDGRPMHLRRIHQALSGLPEGDLWRLGVIAQWKTGPHKLTYRQTERTCKLVRQALAKQNPDGAPSELLSSVLEGLMQASVEVAGEPHSSSYAVDWTDLEAWSRPPPKRGEDPDGGDSAAEQPAPQPDTAPRPARPEDAQPPAEQTPRRDRRIGPEAAWGRRRGKAPGQKDEPFYGYYLQALTIVEDEGGPPVPELARRIHIASCQHDPPAQIVPVTQRMHHADTPIGDLLADSGYSYRQAETFALPIRALGAQPIFDLHPNDRGVKGTHQGAIIANGQLYCPTTTKQLLELGPLPPSANQEQTAEHDHKCKELARYKLSPITGYDQDGYRRVICPAAQAKLRCPLRPESMTLPHNHATILNPPEHPPRCCTQKTITVPPSVCAKTAQKHDYPSPEHRRSYNRRSAAERTFSTVFDPATNDLARGWCRLTDLPGIALLCAAVFIARNLRVADAFNARQAETERRAAHGLPPKRRKRRRQTAEDLISAANAPP